MVKVFIVHFQPLEKYPPVMNLIRFLAARKTDQHEIHVVSTASEDDRKLIDVEGVHIHRLWKWQNTWSRSQRLFNYVRFHTKTWKLLRKHKPGRILYYETLSAGAPSLYKKWNASQCQLFIHYHEYTSPQEYKTGMFFNRWLHQLERTVYRQAAWVSHTNEYRLELFLKDIGKNKPVHVFVLPNFPPAAWRTIIPVSRAIDNRTGFVYVGALSLDTMYVKAFAEYVKKRPEVCYWDIYSDNFTSETKAYFESLNATNIHFKGGVGYDMLPAILKNYQIGVILYKGHIPNYIYNAPNKLFEYLVCGLDVWFPVEMVGCFPYITENKTQEVIRLNFDHLEEMAELPPSHRQQEVTVNSFLCEEAALPLATQLLHIE